MNAIPDRREFLRTTVGSLSLACATWVAAPGCMRPRRLPPGRIDAHTHFYDPSRAGGVPWPPKDDTFLHRTVLPEEFERLARPHGVTSTGV
jgi:hypothetical protein